MCLKVYSDHLYKSMYYLQNNVNAEIQRVIISVNCN